MKRYAYKIDMTDKDEYTNNVNEADRAAKRFICISEHLPEGSRMTIRMELDANGFGHVSVVTDDKSGLTQKDLCWMIGDCGKVLEPVPDVSEAPVNSEGYAYMFCPNGKYEMNPLFKDYLNDTIWEKNHCIKSFLNALKGMNAVVTVNVSSTELSAAISTPVEMTMSMKTMLTIAFPQSTIREVGTGAGTLSYGAAQEIFYGFMAEFMMNDRIETGCEDDDDDDMADEDPHAANEKDEPASNGEPTDKPVDEPNDKLGTDAELENDFALVDDDDEPDGIPIDDLDLSVRAYNCLKRANIHTVEQLLAMSEDEIRRIRNLGSPCFEEVMQKIECYRTIPSDDAKADGTKADPFMQLEEMIGLEDVKEQVKRIAAFARMKQNLEELGKPEVPIVLNMEFTGNPGTAKTTVARILAGIFSSIGILKSSEIVEVGRADIVAKYVGQTADNVKNIFKRAKGKLLFIDEAYSLTDHYRDGYGDEAINTIVQEMENNRRDTVVIFAGYPDEMKKFISMNPGLRSRVPFHISFKDYSAEEMVSIAELEAKKRGFAIAEDARVKIAAICETARANRENGNGRFCRNLVEDAILCYAARVYGTESGSTEKDFTLNAGDFVLPETVHVETKPVRRIGFAA